MSWTILAIAMVGMASLSAPAMAGGYPYCIKGCDFGGARGDCSFFTYRQCQATAAGRDAWCAANPDFNARAEALNDRPRQTRRRF